MTGTDTPCIVSGWVHAIRDFRHLHAHLNNVITAHALTSDGQQALDRQRVIASLLRLRLEVETDLRKLASERQANWEVNPLDTLTTHTKMIVDWNKKIQQAIEMSGLRST